MCTLANKSQAQYSLQEQFVELANRAKLYDAADYIQQQLDKINKRAGAI